MTEEIIFEITAINLGHKIRQVILKSDSTSIDLAL